MEIGGTRQIFPPGGAAAMPMVIGGVAGVGRAFVICASTVLRGICMIAAMSSIDRPWGKISDVNRRPNLTPYRRPCGPIASAIEQVERHVGCGAAHAAVGDATLVRRSYR